MKAPHEMSATEFRVTGRRLARICENLARSITKAREQLDPVVFDYPPVRGVIEALSKTNGVLERFNKNIRTNNARDREALQGGTAQPGAGGSKTGMVDVASVFQEAVQAHTGQMPIVDIDASPDEPASLASLGAITPGGHRNDQIAEFPPGMFRLADILQLVAAHQKSGVVRVKLEKETIEIHLSEGDLTAAQSIDGPVEVRIGQLLVNKGLITQDQLKIVLAANKKSEAKIGQLLREWINLGDEAVSEALRDQLKLLFQRALEHPEANVSFVPAALVENHRDSDTARLNVMGMLLESLAESEGPPEDGLN